MKFYIALLFIFCIFDVYAVDLDDPDAALSCSVTAGNASVTELIVRMYPNTQNVHVCQIVCLMVI